MVTFVLALPDGEEPEATSAESSETSLPGGDNGALELPDELTGGLVAVDLGTLPAELTEGFGDVARLAEQEASIAEGLEETFGVPGAFRVYAAEDGSALAQVTALDRAPGLFTPDALPIDPGVLGVERAQAELVKVDDAVCSLDWGAEVAAGQPVPETPPRAIRCQLGDGDRTYELTAQGLSPDDGAAVLQGLADA
ncbi:MAG: hypothetical protein JWN84_4458 [Nocardioides sp.]|nr:hypothetical protein [Nocardioides sp.]